MCTDYQKLGSYQTRPSNFNNPDRHIFAFIFLSNRQVLVGRRSHVRLNLVNRSFPGLFQPLDYNQGAPLGFLLIEKAVIGLLGSKDYILRLFPLMAGLASIPLMYYVSRKYGKGLASYISLGLFAVSTQLIYYSSELKQYSSDVLMTLILMLVFPKCMEKMENCAL